MNTKEQFEGLIHNLEEKLDETTKALISEERLATLAAYNTAYDEYAKLKEENDKLKVDKEELLKVNGKLYQRIGFDEEEEPKEENIEDNNEETVEITDVINEKGELI